MDGIYDLNNITALADLMNPKDEDSDCEDERPLPASAKIGPGSIGPTLKKENSGDVQKTQPKDKNAIWDDEEVENGAEFDDIHDKREQPDYEIIYKQAVGAEDLFLGMSNKTNATASCEDMVVKIQLPETKGADINLDVKKKFLDCRTTKYKLGLHLPHPVDHKSGKAQWNADKCELCVTLRMVRDYDAFNF